MNRLKIDEKKEDSLSRNNQMNRLDLTFVDFHPGRVEPASSRASTESRTIATHARRS